MVPELETARLKLLPLTLEDAPILQELFPRWEIVRYLGSNVPWPYPPDGALTFVREVALPGMERGRKWFWGIRLKGGPGHLIGVIDVSLGPDENRGFWLAPEWQGRGFMAEACEAAVEFWFNGLEQERLRVSKAPSNLASRRISEREGARLVAMEERSYVSGRVLAEIWELTREEWNARNRRR